MYRSLTRIFCVFIALFGTMNVLIAAAPVAHAQANPITSNSFTSPKYGTRVEWSRAWIVNRDQTNPEQSRDVIYLDESGGDAIVVIELRRQASFRSADAALDTFLDRLGGADALDITEDQTGSYPPFLVYTTGTKGDTADVYVQAEYSETAIVVAAVFARPEDRDATRELANETITVDGFGLLNPPSLCGDSTPQAGGKLKSLDDNDSACISPETPSSVASPTPEPTTSTGKGSDLTLATYKAPTFNVSFKYDPNDWTEVENSSAEENDGRDHVEIDHTSLQAILVVESYAGHGGKASTCIDLSLREWGIEPGKNVAISDADGNPLVGSVQGKAWGAYSFTYTDTADDGQSEELELAAYIECRAMPGAAGVVVVTLLTNPDAFSASFEAIQPILASLQIG